MDYIRPVAGRIDSSVFLRYLFLDGGKTMSLELITEQVFGVWFLIGAACASIEQLGSVFLTTTVAPSISTVVCMIFTWIK